MRHLISILLLCVVAATPLHAQLQVGAGIGAREDAGDRWGQATTAGVAEAVFSNSAANGGRWKWVAIGAVLGGAVGGALAARQVARTEDAFFGGPVIGLGVVAGVVGGGLIGALAHATLHPAPSRTSPNDR